MHCNNCSDKFYNVEDSLSGIFCSGDYGHADSCFSKITEILHKIPLCLVDIVYVHPSLGEYITLGWIYKKREVEVEIDYKGNSVYRVICGNDLIGEGIFALDLLDILVPE